MGDIILQPWSLTWSIPLFLAATAVLGIFGVRLTRSAGQLAERTRMGQAVMGAVFLGAVTSLSGIITSVTAAFDGYAQLAASNALGGIAAQTVFLALADMAYRKANLEHAAASAENLVMGAFVIVMLSIPVLGMATPEVGFFAIHPVSVLLVVAYVFGIYLVSRARAMPMWYPRRTLETQTTGADIDEKQKPSVASLWWRFWTAAAFVAPAGWVVARSGASISKDTGLSESAVGALLTAVVTSLPELITTVTAVRLGALTLAVGDILGGNAFDTLFLSFSDAAYRPHPLYAALSQRELSLLAINILMTSILLMGLLHREKHGLGNIGLESTLIAAIYLVAMPLLLFAT